MDIALLKKSNLPTMKVIGIVHISWDQANVRYGLATDSAVPLIIAPPTKEAAIQYTL